MNLGFHSLGFLAGRLLVALVLVSYTEIMHRKNCSYLRIWFFLFFLLLLPSGQNIFASIASATKPCLAQKHASGAEEQIQQVFVWDVTTKTLYSCRVQGQILQNCTLDIPFDPSGYFANRPLETWPDETEHGFGGNYVDVLIGEFRGLTTPGHAAIGVQYEGTYSIFTFNKLDSRPLDHHQPENYLKYDHDFRHTYSYTLNAADVDPKKVLDALRNYPATGYDVTTNNCAVSSSRGLQAGGLAIGTSYTAQGLEHSLKILDHFRRTHGGARTGLNPLIIDQKIHPPTYKQPVHEKLF